MKRVNLKGEEIRNFILKHVEKHPRHITKLTATKFELTRQAVNRHIALLIAEEALEEKGKTNNKHYTLRPLSQVIEKLPLDKSLEEHLVWKKIASEQLTHLPGNVLKIWEFGFTEMLNNAIDHSEGSKISYFVKRDAVNTEIMILDDGVGIFRKIQRAFGLLDERHAILELAKGKLTTDPKNHSGQGIFFSSRMFDQFDILSGGVMFSHTFGNASDWISERATPGDGTAVWMKLSNHTARTTKKVFDTYASKKEDFGFTKTVVPVRLAKYGNEHLVSRSQAKRLLARVDLFKTVLFDFEDVSDVGQAFADEIFRVFAEAHPEMELIPLNANSEVRKMIERAKGDMVASVDTIQAMIHAGIAESTTAKKGL